MSAKVYVFDVKQSIEPKTNGRGVCDSMSVNISVGRFLD